MISLLLIWVANQMGLDPEITVAHCTVLVIHVKKQKFKKLQNKKMIYQLKLYLLAATYAVAVAKQFIR